MIPNRDMVQLVMENESADALAELVAWELYLQNLPWAWRILFTPRQDKQCFRVEFNWPAGMDAKYTPRPGGTLSEALQRAVDALRQDGAKSAYLQAIGNKPSLAPYLRHVQQKGVSRGAT